MFNRKLLAIVSVFVVLTTLGAPADVTLAQSSSIVYQAENASFGGGATADSNNAGFNGAGFINFPPSGGFLQFSSVDGGSGGSATLQFRFALGATGSRTGLLIVNGAGQSITFQPTGAWTTWNVQNVNVSLNPGATNTIRLESNGQDLANIDQLTGPGASSSPTPTNTQPGPTPTRTATNTPTQPSGGGTLQAENASFGGGAAAESTNGGFNGTGYINFPASGGFLQFNGVDGGSGGSRSLQFRYALGATASRTGLLIVNGASQSITFQSTGAWTTWNTHTVTVNLNAGAGNTVRLESNGQDLANTDQLTVSSGGTGPTSTATATRTPTRTNTPIGPTATPTRTATPPAGGLSVLGADVSSLQRALELGQPYFNASGVQQHPLDILQSAGVNYIRLRVWVNPISGYNNKDKVVAFAPQVKSRGMKLLIDLHYSDTWADPGKQFKPAAWSSHNLTQLQTDVFNHTLDVCNALKNAGATPDMIQVGNEITPGMLFEDGRINNNNFANVSALIKQGYNAVKACNPSTQVMLHIDRGGDNAASRWWFDGVRAQGVNWDVTGLSFYCYWHGTIPTMQSNVADMRTRYGKPVIIAETSYPFSTGNGDSQGNVITSSTPCSGYPASPTGQASNFNAVLAAIRGGGGVGVFYWEPTWVGTPGNGWDPANINGTGSGWDNQAVFDFNFRLNPNIRWTP